jgi:hypoxanthine phosphoribosyltransferase
LTTAKILEEIPDPGIFERLSNSILSLSNKDYASIIENGLNAKGKTVKSPVDGFCQVPFSKPPKFVLIEHTTEKNLKNKWLFDHSRSDKSKSNKNKDGDLIKAGNQVRELRNEFSNAEFVVVLTTNKNTSYELEKEIYKKAKELSIDFVDIWEQSSISRFLDNEPSGHWLRKKYLGIEAELLSKEMFLEICKRSLEDYHSNVLFANNNEFITRDYDEIIENSALNKHFPIHLIVGESGVGKSTTAYKFLEKCLEKGIYALWISAKIIKDSTNIEKAIENLILGIYPKMFQESINRVINEIVNEYKIILIVDDINNSDEPMMTFKKLVSWSKPKEKQKSKFNIICPVWPSIWHSISFEYKGKEWINIIVVGLLNEDEGQKLVQLITKKAMPPISSIRARNLAKKLGNDPFLIDSFSSVISTEDEQRLEILTNDVLDNFLRKETKRIEYSNRSFLYQEYYAALVALSSAMLYKKNFFPEFHEIKEWFISKPNMIDAIKELIIDQRLCKLDENDKFVFKHDRLRNYLQVKTLVNLFHSNEDIDIILSEPYYADIIGQAILKTNNEEILSKLYEMNILSLFESIKYFETSSSFHKNQITKLILTWTENKASFDYKSVLNSICQSLIETDSQIVIDITDNLPKNLLTLLARLRNGCALSGIEYCLLNKYELSIVFPLRDLIIEHAKLMHRTKIREGLISFLVSNELNDKQRVGALILIGYFQFDNCEEEIISCWNSSENKENVLTAALWAGMNCFKQNLEFFFDPLFSFWDAIQDSRKDKHYSLIDGVASSLRLAFGYKKRLDKAVINFLISICESKQSLIRNIEHILNYIDDPEAVEFIVKKSAEHGGSDFTYAWNTKLFDYAHELSKESRARLRSIWEESHNDEIKKSAFELWLTNVEKSELDLLRQITPDSPLSHSAILKRVELGDDSVVQEYVSLLYSHPDFFGEAHNIWDCERHSELMEVARSYLSSFKDTIPSDFTGGKETAHFFIQNLLLFIPENDAETLLNDFWEHLKFDPDFIHAALYVGTPRCIELADLVITENSQNIYLFEHIMSTFSYGFMGYRKTFTEKKINNLLPYLLLFKEDELSSLVRSCDHYGLQLWARKHLYELLSDKDRKLYFPTDEDLVNELKTESKKEHGFKYIESVWIERFDERNDPKSRIFRIIEMLLESEPTLDNLRIAALCIKAKGIRSDINILKKYNILGDEEEVSKIIRDTEYFLCRKTLI